MISGQMTDVVKSAKYWPEMEQAAEMFGHVAVGNLEEETLPDLDKTIKRSLHIKGQQRVCS